MNIVVFGSGSGSNLQALIEAKKKSSLFKIKAVFSDRKCPFMDIAKKNSIPVIYFSFVQFFKDQGVKNHKDPETRQLYDQQIVEKILPFEPDLIILAGYMRLITSPLIQTFENKIINVHPADLAKVDQNGKRLYVGSNSISQALHNRETQTRSTVIFVDKDVDTGHIITFGPWVPYTEGYPITSKKIKRHQNKQKYMSDHPALLMAIEQMTKKVI